MPDSLTPFLFDQLPIRGCIVTLERTWREVATRHAFPPAIETALGELMASAALLSATLKREGALVMQIHAEPGTHSVAPLELAVVECTADLHMRATAKWRGDAALQRSSNAAELVGAGRFVITLDAGDRKNAFQGIVPLEGEQIADWLANYMQRSEQLDTRLVLAATGERAAGMLIQRLPGMGGKSLALEPSQVADEWQRVTTLAATLRPDELLHLDATTVLHRLFHEDDLRLFEPRPLSFRCSCSQGRVAGMLKLLGREGVDGVDAILAEQGAVSVNCNFCNQTYRFGPDDVEQAFAVLH